MAQALIQLATATTPLIQAPLIDPSIIRENRHRFLRAEIPELDLANSFYSASGQWPARGWVLIPRAHLNAISLYATNLQLQIDDGTGPLTFQNLAIVQARCVSRGLAADPMAIYLVELTDARGVLWNPWAAWPINTQYNVRAPAYPEQFYTGTLQGGITQWTWNAMVGDIWNQMPLLGPYPALPISIDGQPENFAFPGMSCWLALCKVLDLLGLIVTYNPTLANPYGIAVDGSADANLTQLLASAVSANREQDDLEFIDSGSGRAPAQVTVYFHVRYQYYGTEETVRMDAFQPQTSALYPVPVAAPAQFLTSAGQGFMFDDFTVRHDVDGNPLAADAANAAIIAAERVGQYYKRIYRGTLGYLRQVYSGAIGFWTGTLLDGVCWEHTQKQRQGWQTTCVRGPQPAFPILDRRWT